MRKAHRKRKKQIKRYIGAIFKKMERSGGYWSSVLFLFAPFYPSSPIVGGLPTKGVAVHHSNKDYPQRKRDAVNRALMFAERFDYNITVQGILVGQGGVDERPRVNGEITSYGVTHSDYILAPSGEAKDVVAILGGIIDAEHKAGITEVPDEKLEERLTAREIGVYKRHMARRLNKKLFGLNYATLMIIGAARGLSYEHMRRGLLDLLDNDLVVVTKLSTIWLKQHFREEMRRNNLPWTQLVTEVRK